MNTLPSLSLILGGASSGKSAYAERLALGAGLAPVYIATAQAHDGEMADKITSHQARRGASWQLVEAPLAPAEALRTLTADHVVLLDCLTLWLSNLMEANRVPELETAALLAAIKATPARVIAVSNELGLGLVPATPLGRRFREAQGILNQQFAEAACAVTFVAAGLPLFLKAPE
ncbi:MAG: bifunctional adenosylcobinamide kinase/adenosylcobinamide-phosphate guanylyltransferase [Rhodobacteraceae bacterium]|nr:bifunctional adenosylcobinamide kinase/adenosylcobinamide-phosphate guanylyltransferase [Paracoccaceae bacterium]